MKQIFLVVAFILSSSAISIAQYDSIVNAFQKDFEQFKQSAIQKQVDFLNHNDSVFISFLKESWEQVEVFKSQSKEEPKPVTQPVIRQDTLSQQLDFIQPKPAPLLPGKESIGSGISELKPVNFNSRMVVNSLDFYGAEEKIYYSPQLKPEIQQVNESAIINFYTSLSQNSSLWDYNLDLLLKARKKYLLNDWGYFQLVKSASQSIFNGSNEQQLFSWYLLLKSGYQVKVGYDKNEIYLLIPSVHKLYNVLYLADLKHTYYIPDTPKKEITNLKTYRAAYPGSDVIFSFDLNEYPAFMGEQVFRTLNYKDKTIVLSFQQANIDFLNSYPLCELSAYFHSGISKKNLQLLDQLLNPFLDGKNDRVKIDELLTFCQKALDYKTDQDQFGMERYFFAEESLFYPFCDCEDRAILLATLVKRYTGLSSIGLDFPGHVALAVHFPNDENGTFITYNNQKYTVCDPTYVNAKSGMLPKEFETVKAEIITF